MEETPADDPVDLPPVAEQPLEAAEPEDAPRGMNISASSAPASASSSPLARIRQARHVRSGSFQRWRSQMQRAWRWGPSSCGSGLGNGGKEQSVRAMVNFEMMVNQKRQWYQIKAKARDHRQNKEPTSLYEHFFIVGLHSYANVEAVEDAFAKRKTWESEVAKSEILDLRKLQYHASIPTLEPQILFKYPPGKKAAMREHELPSFCFPESVKARLIERTPSMSDLNEVVFGQDHLSRDDLAFIFCLKASDNAPLYGVCLHIQEIVQRAPGILGSVSPIPHSSCKSSRFLVAAPRCYCLLTRVPFFELHYEMLNSIIAQERLDRITHFVSEMALTESISRGVMSPEQLSGNADSPNRQLYNSWMEYAIPVDSVSGLISSSVFPMEREAASPSRSLEPPSPESTAASEASDFGHIRELERETRRTGQSFDDNMSETSELRSDSFERLNGCFENGHASPEVGMMCSSASGKLQRVESLESVYSSVTSVRDVGSDDDDDDELSSKNETSVGDEKVMEWAKANNNEPLQIVCGYHALPLPPRGGEIIFHPLEHLQPIKYCRPAVSSLGLDGSFAEALPSSPKEANEVNARLAAAEEALALSIWTTATICRALSLESILTLFAGALLEKQVVILCPNLVCPLSLNKLAFVIMCFISLLLSTFSSMVTDCYISVNQVQGMLSAIVLSIIPMIRPFQWHSLLLPILPVRMMDFLDAPVPYLVGVQHKPVGIKIKTANLVHVNVYKDKVKTCSLPRLPRYKELVSDLGPIHARLSCENAIAKRYPIYKCSEVQAEAARQFLDSLGCYLESLCSNLRSHTITNVQSNNDKVSLLLKDSFIDSFPSKDRPFIKLFIDTQLFSDLSDSRLSRYENE
ncbi:hypothetical protein Cni_G19419 [Canna indica]|uniref:UDENN domain-containing protein n=1 Tax=Canna indica TaxID=4628 RepID=A0AAQ3KL14_9LILI|nr:hypothetical protein Cni_G19419 [Canna indica]